MASARIRSDRVGSHRIGSDWTGEHLSRRRDIVEILSCCEPLSPTLPELKFISTHPALTRCRVAMPRPPPPPPPPPLGAYERWQSVTLRRDVPHFRQRIYWSDFRNTDKLLPIFFQPLEVEADSLDDRPSGRPAGRETLSQPRLSASTSASR